MPDNNSEPSNLKTAKDWVIEAASFRRKKDYNKELECYKKAAEIKPNNASIVII